MSISLNVLLTIKNYDIFIGGTTWAVSLWTGDT